MISEKAKAFAKRTDIINERKEVIEDKVYKVKQEEAKFMDKYKRCPHCNGKVKVKWLQSFFSRGDVWGPYKCTNCGLTRTYYVSSGCFG